MEGIIAILLVITLNVDELNTSKNTEICIMYL